MQYRKQRSNDKIETDSAADKERKTKDRLNQIENVRTEEREETQERVEWFRLKRNFEKWRRDCDAENERQIDRRSKMNDEDRPEYVEQTKKL